MTDIHSHILPNIDDGAVSLAEAAIMLRLAAESGTQHIVATPHFFNLSKCKRELTRKGVLECFSTLKEYAEKEKIPVHLYLGAENFGVDNISELIEKKELIPINSSRYVLVEFSFYDSFDRVCFCLSQLLDKGFIPVVAHPERYRFVHNDPSVIFGLLEQGCLLQVNKGSILGRYGEEETACSRWLIKNRYAFCVASDSHGSFKRTPDMSRAFEWVEKKFGRDYADELFDGNPMKLLKDITV